MKNLLPFALFVLTLLLGSNKMFAQCPGTPPLSFTFESTESRCESNGTITLHIVGGTPFTDLGGNPIYNNTIIAPIVLPIGGQADSVFAALAADTYTVEVLDANGCSATADITVPGTHMQLELEIEFEDAKCDGTFGGSICGTPAEGRPFPPGYYEYQLFDASTVPATPITARGLDSCFLDLAAGSYEIVAYDSCGNFQTRSVIISTKQYSSFQISGGLFYQNCTEACFRFAAWEVTGGFLPEYPVDWVVSASDDPDILGLSGALSSRSEFDTLCVSPMYQSGTYEITFTDLCGQVITRTNSMEIRSPIIAPGFSCQDGNTASIRLNNYPYCASGSMTFESTQVPAGSAPLPPQNSPVFTNLDVGFYCFLITECCGFTTNRCVTITDSPPLIRLFTNDEYACKLGNVSFAIPNSTTFEYIITSAPAGYPIPLPDTISSFALVEGPPGTYCITMEDACRSVDSCFVFTDPLTADYEAVVTEACVTGNSIEINFNQTGGKNLGIEVDFYQIAPINTVIQENQQNLSWFNLSAGTYLVELENTRGNDCPFITDTIVIAEYIQPTITGTWGIECDNGVGLISVEGSNGTPPYTYELFQGPVTRPLQSTPDFPGLPLGTYDIRMYDDCGNSEITTQAIEPFMPVIKGYGGVACLGDSVTIFVDYLKLATYAWSGPNGNISDTTILTIPNITLADAGTYTIDIDVANPDQTSCIAQTLTVEIVVANCTCEIDTILATDVSCFGDSTGTATVSITSGISPYTFEWSNGDSTQMATGLMAGTYTVTVTDAANCITTSSVLLEESDSLYVSLERANTTCNGDADGSIFVNALGGDQSCNAVSFIWNTGATTQLINNLTPGIYSVTATDCNGCVATGSREVGEPDPLTVSMTGGDPVSCFGESNGSISVTVSGGNPITPSCSTYSYLWSNGATTPSISGLTASAYTITVTDCKGCAVTASYAIAQPAELSCSVTGTNIPCNGDSNGTASAMVVGGTNPYSYLWSDGSMTQSISGLAPGTYNATVTDDAGCTTTCEVEITEPTALFSSGEETNILCAGDTTGNIDLTVTGGVVDCPTFASELFISEYIEGSSFNKCIEIFNGTGAPVSMSDYELRVHANGNANGNALSLPAVTVMHNDVFVICHTSADAAFTAEADVLNGSLNFNGDDAVRLNNISGTSTIVDIFGNLGCDPGSSWSAGSLSTRDRTLVRNSNVTTGINVDSPMSCPFATLATEWTGLPSDNASNLGMHSFGNAPGAPSYDYLWSTGETTEDLSGLNAGVYTVTVSDCNGCTIIDSFVITAPDSINISADSIEDVSCFSEADGSISIAVTGGSISMTCTDYTYTWSNGATTATNTGLVAGEYEVTVSDCNGCIATASFPILEPAALSCSVSGANSTCNASSDGSATVSASGGSLPYTYEWSNGATTEMISGLSADTYSITVSDAAGCTTTCEIIVTNPTALTLSSETTEILCFGDNNGAIDLTVSGGNPADTIACSPNTFIWSNGETTEDISGLTAGTYTVTVNDCNGCFAVDTIMLVEPAALVLTDTIENITCSGEMDGVITLTVTGGTLQTMGCTDYLYDWNTGETTKSITGLAAGTYTVTVSDCNGCSETQSIMVTEPDDLIATTFGVLPSCFGGSDGSYVAVASGGTPPYSYVWSNGATSEVNSGLTAGNYSVTITDSLLCTLIDNFMLLQPDLFEVSLSGVDLSCNGDLDGMITSTVSGGIQSHTTCPGVQYLWNNGATSADITGLSSGTYILTATDCNGCVAIDSLTIAEPSELTCTIEGEDVGCYNADDGSAVVTVSGGTMPYSYNWSNGMMSNTITNLSAGSYTVTVTDNVGCSTTCSVSIGEPDQLNSTVSITNVSCSSMSDGQSTVTGVGGTPGYTYLWNTTPPSSTALATGLSVGTYTVSITDMNGCSDITNVVIDQLDCDPCQQVILEDLDICDEIVANPSSGLDTLDCDLDGVINITECMDNTDPTDPCDFEDTSITLPVTADQSDCENLCPDLTPIITILPGNISGISAVGLAIQITELRNVDTDGSDIIVRVPSDPRMVFTWDPLLTFVAFTPVDNSDWTYLGDNGLFHSFEFSGNTMIINGGTTSAFGMEATYDPQSTDGQTTITATIVPFSGGECNITNNTDAERLVYFN